ncbi:type II secretion system protein GspG [Lysobacter pythonis]|uniref:Type II secretion system core protein G n=1 Tax=Solilutibacter pythonis TaxID=2483112 RepID=A0A3M2HSQ9_9GAMM|nr:type II secretion system major pseudopilin GspG [Lysobacter pythonis]RMH90863.1 type II secretion system protein GspG [Lysobacter pythonis]
MKQAFQQSRNRSLPALVRGRERLGRRQSGFTLIEIVLVVMLIGVVVAFAASRILGGGDRAKVGLAKAQLQTTADKIEQYKMDVGQFPAKLNELLTQPQGSSGWLGPYAKEVELKDPWGNPIQYKVPGEGGKPFSLVSFGRDGKPGGSSVDADLASE